MAISPVSVEFSTGDVAHNAVVQKLEISEPVAHRKAISSLDRERIREALQRTLIYFIDCGYPCALEGLGIIFPIEKATQRVETATDSMVISVETVKTIEFEKTDVIYQCHRSQFTNLLEDRDISDKVFEKIGDKLSLTCTESDVRREIKNIIRQLKHEVLEGGWSSLLDQVGIFIAHHNRQGTTKSDWFAGADIFLDRAWHKKVTAHSTSKIKFPELVDAFEPFEMQYGKEIASIDIDLSAAITKLGFESPLAQFPPCSVRAYKAQGSKKGQRITFVTNGLRHIAFAHAGTDLGSEIVIELAADIWQDQSTYEIPTQAITMIAVAALLIASSKSGTALHYVAVPLQEIFGVKSHQPHTLVTFPYKKIGQAVRCIEENGNYYYSLCNLITEAEAIAIQANHKYLLSLFLNRKGYFQETYTNRPCVLNRTAVDKKFIISGSLAL